MSETETSTNVDDGSLHSAASKIASLMEPATPAEKPEEAQPQPNSLPEGADAAPDENPPSGNTEAVEDTEDAPPAVEPPSSWSASERETWKSLPPAAQLKIAERERERDVELRRGQNEVAEARKQAEAAREQYHGRLKDVVPALEQQLQDRWAGVDWVKLATDYPADYTRLKAIHEQEQAQVKAAQDEKARLDAQAARDHQGRVQTYLAEQADELVKAIPSWKDEKAGVAELGDIRSYLLKQGIPQEAVNQLSNAKQILIARKAMLYDQAQSRIAKPAPAATAPKVLRPGNAEPKPNQTLAGERQRFAQSGRIEDAAALIKRMI